MTDGTLLMSDERASDAVSPRDVGGKAWNLLRLRERGFRVPRFWIVPRGHFDRVVLSCRDTIGRSDCGDSDGTAAARIQSAIDACALPADLTEALLDALPAGRLFAVRSSAVGEDSGQHSFAGMLDSVLNASRVDVPAALKRVWASAFAPRALLYRTRKGLTLEETATSVIVQEMVQATRAGVLFTRDPADRARRIVVSAGLGLGKGIVEDTVETDTYRVDWDGSAWSCERRDKRSRVVLADASEGGVREEAVPRRLRRRPALRPRELRELHRLGREVEGALGGPQDIEWAYDGHRRLFALQARPIVEGPAPLGARRVWDNANVVESYPGVTLPLTYSFASRAYRRAFERVARSFLAPPARPGLYDELLGLLDGRVYYNLLAWYEMFAFLPGADRYRASWDELVGVGERIAPARVRLGAWRRTGTLAAALAILLRGGSLGPRFRGSFAALRARFADAGQGEATIDEVLERFRSLEEAAASFWHLTLQNDFCVLKLHQWAAALLDRCGRKRDLPTALRCGAETVESVKPVRSLQALLEEIRADAGARALFGRDDDRAIWTELGADPRWRGLRGSLERHLADFGDRAVAELKLETPTFAEDPPLLVGLLKHWLSLGLSSAARDSPPAPPGDGPRRHGIRGAAERVVLRLVLRRARTALRAREEMRLARTRLFGIVRRLVRRLGGQLAEQGFIGAPGDVHYLAIGELLDFARGTGVTRGMRELVSLRKAEYARFAASALPARLETRGVPRPDVLPAAVPSNGPHRSLTGTGCSPGIVTGRAAVVLAPERAVAGRDLVLVAPSTDPGWVFLMMSSAGIVVERGSLLSHTAIIGRELGIPTVVGASGATRLIPDGARLSIDGGTGDVRWA